MKSIAKPGARQRTLKKLAMIFFVVAGMPMARAAASPQVGDALVARGATFELPVTQSSGWQFLQYGGIPPNVFHSTSAGLVIEVSRSAAPAVFPLTRELRVTELRVRGKISGSINVPPSKQGKKSFDDFTLRVGLVQPGTHTLSWWQKLIAAPWVKTLFSLAPAGQGIGGIHFFSVGTSASQIGRNWSYHHGVPMEQTVVAVADASGHFDFTKHFAKPVKIVAVWISSDGDDTHSSFTVTLDQVEFETVP